MAGQRGKIGWRRKAPCRMPQHEDDGPASKPAGISRHAWHIPAAGKFTVRRFPPAPAGFGQRCQGAADAIARQRQPRTTRWLCAKPRLWCSGRRRPIAPAARSMPAIRSCCTGRWPCDTSLSVRDGCVGLGAYGTSFRQRHGTPGRRILGLRSELWQCGGKPVRGDPAPRLTGTHITHDTACLKISRKLLNPRGKRLSTLCRARHGNARCKRREVHEINGLQCLQLYPGSLGASHSCITILLLAFRRQGRQQRAGAVRAGRTRCRASGT